MQTPRRLEGVTLLTYIADDGEDDNIRVFLASRRVANKEQNNRRPNGMEVCFCDPFWTLLFVHNLSSFIFSSLHAAGVLMV